MNMIFNYKEKSLFFLLNSKYDIDKNEVFHIVIKTKRFSIPREALFI